MNIFPLNINQKVVKYAKIKGIRCGDYKRLAKGKDVSLITLYKCTKDIGIDIRNLLICDDNTYNFTNSFDSLEDFVCFVGSKLKKIKKEKGITVKHIANQINKSEGLIREMHRGKCLSISALYEYLHVLGLTLDEFFLSDACGIATEDNNPNDIISVEEIDRRAKEIEVIQGRKEKSQSWADHTKYPTLHAFLRLCRNLRVNPEEFFNFDIKEFSPYRKVRDINTYADVIKKRLGDNGFEIKRYIELDAIFLFCKEKNIPVIDFLTVYDADGNIRQMRALMR